jgi:hypothetical protein
MQELTFIGFDGNRYAAKTVPGKYDIRHDGRFWHISFPIEGEAGGMQVYRGRELPQSTDHDRWVRYRPYPAGMKNRSEDSAGKLGD